MILLEKHNYDLALEPIEELKINTLFAQSVIKHHITGKVYADSIEKPTTFYVIHPYGMTLLFGDLENEKFNDEYIEYILNVNKTRSQVEWMQVSPDSCNEKFLRLLENASRKKGSTIEEKIEKNTRVNFKFNIKKYQLFKQKNITQKHDIVRTNKKLFESIEGTVVPKHFWDKAEDFLKMGIGFSLMVNGKHASTSYSAFLLDNKLELGIETIENYRGKGYAKYACSALIDYCLENNYAPVWACRLENKESYQLAEKLGFEPTLYLPYYKINS